MGNDFYSNQGCGAWCNLIVDFFSFLDKDAATPKKNPIFIGKLRGACRQIGVEHPLIISFRFVNNDKFYLILRGFELTLSSYWWFFYHTIPAIDSSVTLLKILKIVPKSFKMDILGQGCSLLFHQLVLWFHLHLIARPGNIEKFFGETYLAKDDVLDYTSIHRQYIDGLFVKIIEIKCGKIWNIKYINQLLKNYHCLFFPVKVSLHFYIWNCSRFLVYTFFYNS